MKDSERKGRPSASEAKANRLCHGRHQMSLPMKDKTSKAASDGTEQHKFLEDDTYPLREDLRPLAEEAMDQRNQVIGMVWGDWRDNPPEVHSEERLWYRGDKYSGKADYVGIRGNTALIIDYKFGPLKVDRAERNDQLLWLAVLVFTHYKVSQITVSIVQPLCGEPSIHTYTADDLQRARRRVLWLIRKIDSKHAMLRAGTEQCRYCKAIQVCPAAEGKRDAISRIEEGQVSELTNAHLLSLLESLPLVKKLSAAIEDEAVIRLKTNPQAIKGYELRKGSSKRRISDPVQANDRLLKSGVIDESGIAVTYSIALGKLTKVVSEYNECGPKEARELIREALGDVLVQGEGKEQACRIES